MTRSYFSQKGGLPAQTALMDTRAVFTEAFGDFLIGASPIRAANARTGSSVTADVALLAIEASE